MSRLTPERAVAIIDYNTNMLYHIPHKYKAVRYYLGASHVRRTLLKILRFLRDLYTIDDGQNHIIIDGHRYEFFLHSTRLAYGIRKSGSTATANRHINFLCAIGIFKKIPQVDGDRLRVNDNFKAISQSRREINVFSFFLLDDRRLEKIEERAQRLKYAGVTAGNVSYNKLALSGLEDIADEVYPYNNRTAPEKKLTEYAELRQCIEMLIDAYGYAKRDQIRDNLTLKDAEIDRLFRIFKLYLSIDYNYHKPTRAEIQKYQLQDQKFIYTRRENTQ